MRTTDRLAFSGRLARRTAGWLLSVSLAAVTGRAQTPANGQPIFTRHHQVQHDQVDRLAQQDAGERLAVFGQQDVKTFLAEVAAQQVPNAGIVVYHKNFVGSGRRVWHGGK